MLLAHRPCHCLLPTNAHSPTSAPLLLKQDVSSNLLRISEALLAGGAACRHAAEKLAAVCRCAWGERAHPDAPDGKEGWVSHPCWRWLLHRSQCLPSCHAYGVVKLKLPARITHPNVFRQAVLLRLTVEPAAAVAISQAIDGFGGQGREMVGGSGLPVWAEEHPLGEVIGHLVMGDE